MKQLLESNLQQTIKTGKLLETSLPLCPAISLYLLSDDYPTGKMEQDEMLAIINSPAYWAFSWASGQVLGHYILNHKSAFENKRILDFGSGSGVVAIAAALAGASEVIACDIDPHAIDACTINAALNQVDISLLSDIKDLKEPLDMVIAADVLYDRDNMPWLDVLPDLACEVIIADSRVKNIELHGYEIVNRVSATTIPDLDEFREFTDVKVYKAIV
mgnify:CR=1 FL=1